MWSRICAHVFAGDPDAFGVLFDQYAHAVCNLGFRLTGNWSAAEEVVSVTFLEAWRLRNRIGPGGEPLRPWLLGIAVNVSRNLTRASRRHQAALSRLPPPPPVPDFADELAGRLDDEARLREAGKALGALLAKIATAAARQPAPQVRNSQFWYIKSWVAGMGCYAAAGKCVLDKPHERQIWQSVSNLCVTGLLREHGQNIPLAYVGNRQHCPYRGGVNDPSYRFLQSLPTDPHALLSLIERHMSGQQPPPQEAFITIGDLLHEAIAPPRVSAALYRVAALIPGVTVIADATDATTRHAGSTRTPLR
jgi:DNA-directed RNA polymerase specialized sigma24 family protein